MEAPGLWKDSERDLATHPCLVSSADRKFEPGDIVLWQYALTSPAVLVIGPEDRCLKSGHPSLRGASPLGVRGIAGSPRRGVQWLL